MTMTLPGPSARRAAAQAVEEDRARPTGATSSGIQTEPSTPVAPAHVASLLKLQRTAGNAAVANLVRTMGVQRWKEPGWGSRKGGDVPAYGPDPPTRQTAVQRQPAGVAEHLVTAAEKAAMASTADAPALLAENKAIYAAREARRKAADEAQKRGETVDPATKKFTAEEQARVDVLNRKLKLRFKGDEEETLKKNEITTGAAAWFAKVKSVKFLGKSVTVHSLLAERLAKAETALSGETPPDPGGWFTSTSSLRPPRAGLHSFGLAIDINPTQNPYLVNPNASGAEKVEVAKTSSAIWDVINRAMLLILAKTPAEADFQSRPANRDKDARAPWRVSTNSRSRRTPFSNI